VYIVIRSSPRCGQAAGRIATCLSLSPISRISSIRVNLGCLSLSALSLMSRGSKAILCPFSPLSYDVSRPPALFSSLRLLPGTGELTRLPSSLSKPAAGPAPPLLLVKPELEAILGLCNDVVCLVIHETPRGCFVAVRRSCMEGDAAGGSRPVLAK
jgi:hypothetical protein